jgi:SAM-dependent methyltransferase
MTARDLAADHAAELLDLIEAKWTTQAIGVAAELAIPDLIAAGTADLAALARASGCHADSLRRLMRALTSLGLSAEVVPGRYALTPLGELLRSDGEPSLRAWARWGARHHWQPWGELLETVRSGANARARAGEKSGYTHIGSDAARAATFNQAMVEISSLVAAAVACAHDFSSVRRVADIGGGYGALLCGLLSRHGHLEGVLFDLPHAMAGARARIDKAGLAARCEVAEGSFFDAMPEGCDLHVLKSIVHNWDDERAIAILEGCRRALPAAGRLLLVERVMPEHLEGDGHERRIVRSDLNMLVTHAGRERTRSELEALLALSGFAARRIEPLAVGFSLVEAAPA